jgi:hypothetical protein
MARTEGNQNVWQQLPGSTAVAALIGLNQGNARAKAQGVRFARSVKHPGTPPRPFFGMSRNDKTKLIFYGQKFYRDAVRRLGLG